MVRYGCSSVNKEMLEQGELDLTVVFEWQGTPRGEVLMVDPTVWATTDQHRVHEQSPLPVALYENSGWCMEFALRSLETAGIHSLESRGHDYRVTYRSDTNGGLKLAVSSGLAIAPLSRSNIPEGCRELTEAEGFGAIDSSNVVMYLRRNENREAVLAMADAIREAFRTRTATG